jgi:pilus assembly protein CpaB
MNFLKNSRALTMIGLSFVVAAVAVWVASRWVSQQSTLGTKQLAVAALDIPAGSRLTADMLRVVPWPSAALPAGGTSHSEVLVGRVVKSPVAQGEPLTEARLAPAGTKGGLSAVVADGKRAMTVRVNDVIGVAGFALPGNYVDIIVNTQEDRPGQPSSEDKRVSKIVLERILVLAVAQESGRDETRPKVVNAVTLELSPEQAEALDLARSVGTLSLVLRNQVDPRPTLTAGATKSTLLVARPALVPAAVVVNSALHPALVPIRRAAAPKPLVIPLRAEHCVTVITGVDLSRECF